MIAASIRDRTSIISTFFDYAGRRHLTPEVFRKPFHDP